MKAIVPSPKDCASAGLVSMGAASASPFIQRRLSRVESDAGLLRFGFPATQDFTGSLKSTQKSITGKSCNAFSDLTSVESLRSFLGSLQNNLILTDYSLEMSLNGSSVLPDADKWSLERNYLVSDRPHSDLVVPVGKDEWRLPSELHRSPSSFRQFSWIHPEESYDYEYSYNAPAFHITWRKHDVFEVVYNEESHRFYIRGQGISFPHKILHHDGLSLNTYDKICFGKDLHHDPRPDCDVAKAILVQSDDAFHKVVIKDTRGM